MQKLDISILYIDTNKIRQKIIKKYFKDLIKQVYICENINNATKQQQYLRADLVIIYEDLDDMSGLDLLLKLRELNRSLPSIIITQENNRYLEFLSKVDSRNSYLKEPFSHEELFELVKSNISKISNIKDFKKSEHLLKQYKHALDSSAIVSKTDQKGIITYVNDTFCQISGYTENELIGKPHNIVRHPDMPKSAFEELWRTIKAKMVWRGEIKNKAKDGSAYYVYSTVMPILDNYGQIIEFIAIRFETTELENALKEAQRAKESQEVFLANMSHEIRTPLNGILGFTNLLTQMNLKEKANEYVQIINSSASSLLHTINEILDISKIQSGKMELEIIGFNIHKEVKHIRNLFIAKADEKNIKFNFYVDNNIPKHIKSDMMKIKQILSNLVSNAIKFTPNSKTVTLQIQMLSKNEQNNTTKIKFMVKDEGIGIPKDALKKIFKPFVQASSDTTRKFGGTGLGLAIAKDMVRLLGGNLEVQSEVNKGTIFSFSFDVEYSNEELENKTISKEYIYQGNVLVAEDNETNQKLIKIILEQKGLNVTIAQNGQVAVDIFKDKLDFFDLVLSDINMPVMDGIEACKQINKIKLDNQITNIPIIALTANSIKGDKEKLLDICFDEYLSKPIQTDELNNILNKFLQKQTANNIDSQIQTDNIKQTKPSNNYDINQAASKMGVPVKIFKTILKEFLSTVEDETKLLKEYISKKDFKNIKEQAHKLKGACGNLVIMDAYEILKQIEHNSQNNNDIDYISLVDKLDFDILKDK
jgi:PAS domain S-box-containing protein